MELDGLFDVAWKSNQDIFVTLVSDELEIPFRLPPVHVARRYSFLLNNVSTFVDKLKVYERIFEDCCCDPSLLDGTGIDIPAGLSQTIAQLILWFSGYSEESIKYTQELFEANRAQTDDTLAFMKRTICSVFKAYTFEDVDELDYQTVVKIFIQAEKVLLEAGIIEKEYKITEPKERKPTGVNVEELMKQDKKDFSKVDGPPAPHRLQPGERPPAVSPSQRRRRAVEAMG